jgi:Ca-activated chloride channel family protein
MSCPQELELFLVHEGNAANAPEGERLSPEREKEVAAHLASCAECQAKLAELEALANAIAAPDPLTAGERTALVAAAIRRIDAQESRAAARAGSGFWSIGVPVAAAVCCGLVALIVVPTFFVLSARDGAAPMVAAQRESAPPPAAVESAPGRFAQAEMDEESGEGEERQDRVRRRPASPAGYATPTGAPSTIAVSPAHPPAAMPAPMPAEPAQGYFGDDGLAKRGEAPRGGAPGALRYKIGGPADDPLGGMDMPGAQAKASEGASPQAFPPAPARDAYGRGPSGAFGETPLATMTPPRPSAIDPNGRFATTYRPGRGHLARFETALFRGQVPEPALSLVADSGRGAGPALPAPTERALALDIRTDLGRLPPEGGPVHVALTLRSTTSAPASRPEVAVHIVMDTSGSMSGMAIEHARQAARRLVELLEPGDRFSLVSYSTDARLMVAEGPVGSRRPQILHSINALEASGSTNLEAGLRMGYGQAQASRGAEDAVQLVVVLSDGQPNQGITDPWTLSEMAATAFQAGVETTSIGVGDSYEPQVMSTLAEYGAGGYYYLPDASSIEQVLRAELDVRCQPVARAVELRVRLGDGVELLEAYGSRRLTEMEAQRVRSAEITIDHQEAYRTGIATDRQEDREGGMRFFIPGFARDDQHTILLRLRAPAGSSGAALALANVELRYKDRVLASNQGDERQVDASYGASRAEALADQDRDVRRAVVSFRTGQALSEVSQRLSRGDRPGALALLYERAVLLRHAAEELDDPALRAEAGRLDSFRSALASQWSFNQLMMGSLLQRAGSGMMR